MAGDSMREAARRIAGAVQEAGESAAAGDGPGRYRATVLRWLDEDDFELDLHGEDLTLEPEDVTLGQSVRRYEKDFGIVEGDGLILLEVGDSDYVAVDVESDTEA